MRNLLSPLSFALAALFIAPGAHALAGYVTQMPSAPNSCNTCHTEGGGSPRNVFGEQVGENLSGGLVDWAALCGLDADGDGETNGQELGDACCVWESGDDPAVGDTSDPADAESVSGNECTFDGEGTGGCAGSHVQSGTTPAALAAVLAAVALLSLRRRRR